MCVLTAKELVELITAEESSEDNSEVVSLNLDSHVRHLQRTFPGKTIIYMIEGLTAWYRKNRTIKDRQFKDAVRSHGGVAEMGGGTASQNTAKRRKKKEEEYVDEDRVEEALLRLQMEYNVLIHHTNVLAETAEWVWVFTQHISTRPYKTQLSLLPTTFCMDSGQIKTGSTPSEVYIRMLQEMPRVTAAIAHGIAAHYPSVQALVAGLKKEGPLALEDCEKSANRDGAFSGRRVGPAVSRRVWKVFTGREEGSWDV